MFLRRNILIIVATVLAAFTTPVLAHDDAPAHDMHRIVIQVSDNDPGTFTKVLNNVGNMSKFFLDRGEDYEIEVVVYNAGLHMLRADTSDVLERLDNMAVSVPNLTFSACGNTIELMSKKAGKQVEITQSARVVPGGIIRLMELSDQGYFMIRP